MSGSKDKSPAPPVIPDPGEVAERNPAVDIKQLREADRLLDELSKHGVTRPEYDIASPYERRPLRHKR